jgi:tripartite-type tricarboxylate transporter receptor subunit TctC
VLDAVNTALKQALKDSAFIRREETLGAVVITVDRVNGAAHKAFVEAEINKWGPLIKAAGQYAD